MKTIGGNEMNLEKLYIMQQELDNHILENEKKRTGKEIDKDLLLDQTILALLVEVGELANATRCFKHWSVKGPMAKEIILDELADVLHFYLSLGNQVQCKLLKENIEYTIELYDVIEVFKNLYYFIMEIDTCIALGKINNKASVVYGELGIWIKILWDKLGFSDEEVEQAYMKKHEENYRRQREGY